MWALNQAHLGGALALYLAERQVGTDRSMSQGTSIAAAMARK
jgi:hypothetical protein